MRKKKKISSKETLKRKKKKEKKAEGERSISREVMIVRVNREYYGIPLDNVEEIKKQQKLVITPQLPEFVIGVVELRDLMIPLVDFAKLLGIQKGKEKKSSNIIVEISNQLVGLVVSEVVRIVEIRKEEILPLPEIFPSRLFIGAYAYNSNLVGIIRMKGLLKGKRLRSFKEISDEISEKRRKGRKLDKE
ncbi:MAG: chemotaxis protein CheW [candidate division WOR-3 bacterium]|nr:chemotaxis protein CheW [candidate division WOR-3 bacterium]